MQRSALPKSRAEKGKAASATPAVTHEIIPGKYNDQDWNLMLDHDDGDDFISDIIEEISSNALDIIFKAYIQNQLIPYTVCQAKDAIIQIIEWQFLTRDEGEMNYETDPGWMQDEEPEPAVTDCWAQGSVPKQRILPRPMVKVDEEVTLEEEKDQDTEIEIKNKEDDLQEPETVEQATEEAQTEETSVPVEESEMEKEHPQTPNKTEAERTDMSSKKKKRGYKPHTGRLPSAGLKNLTESLEETEMKMYQDQYEFPSQTPNPDMLRMPASCHSILKLQAGRPPGNREVVFDQQGNVISVYRLDPEKLPSHKVRTGFRVVDPAVEAAQTRLEAMRTGRHLSKKSPRPPNSMKPTSTRSVGFTSKTAPKPQTVVLTAINNYGNSANSLDVAPLPPPMIDTMELVPGVVVKEGDRVKKGPKPYGKKMEVILGALHNNLKPVSRQPELPTLTVAELLEHQTPIVKPLVDNTPVPPISAQSQYT